MNKLSWITIVDSIIDGMTVAAVIVIIIDVIHFVATHT